MRTGSVLDNIREKYDSLFSAEKKAADRILLDPKRAILLNITELASASNVSEATIVRMCKHVGYDGYYKMRLILSNDIGKEKASPDMKSPAYSVQDLFDRLAHNVKELASHNKLETYLECAAVLKRSRLVYVVGAGNMTPIAMDMGYRLERFGIRTSFTDVSEYYLNHVSMGKKEDALFIMSKSGISKQTLQAVEIAKKRKMTVIVITGTEKSPIAKAADLLLLSTCGRDIFEGTEPDNHLYEIAVCDVLLYCVRHGNAISKHSKDTSKDSYNDDMELLLSEYKL